MKFQLSKMYKFYGFILFSSYILYSCTSLENKKNISNNTEKIFLENSDIDSLFVDNRKFILKKDSLSNFITISYLENGKLIENIKTEVFDQFEITFDCNHDGYNDIYSQKHGWNYINYYLPKEKIFSKQYQMPGDEEILIDSINKVYANYREPYTQCYPYNSQLIDYKNTIPNIRYMLAGETFSVNGDCILDSIEYFKYYKYNSIKDTMLLLKKFKPKNPKDFDYKNFWKENYKKID